MASKKKDTKTEAPKGETGIPGAQDRQAVIDETRAEEGNGQEAMGNGEKEDAPSEPTPAPAPPGAAPSAVKSSPAPKRASGVASVSYRGARRYRCVPIVEDGIAYSVDQTIRLTARAPDGRLAARHRRRRDLHGHPAPRKARPRKAA